MHSQAVRQSFDTSLATSPIHTVGVFKTRVRGLAPFLPLLGLYGIVVLVAASAGFQGDEEGYVEIARRLLHRSSGALPEYRLWWGPGYPLVLAPFLVAGAPWIAAKLLNAVFLFGAVVYLHALLVRYVQRTPALLIALSFGLYPPLMREVQGLNPESLTLFLVCGFMYHFCCLYLESSRFQTHLFASSAYLAYLAVTKVFFGYVIVSVLMLSVVLLAAVRRQTRQAKTVILVSLSALALCTPYLSYTYSLTGKLFYWGTSGGMQLYWMTSPYRDELGSWFSVKDVKERPDLAQHRQFFATLENLSDVDRDAAYKKEAVKNIRQHPVKYLYNWAANVGRLLFSYPFSLGPQSLTTYFYMAPNMFVVVLFVLSIGPALLRPRAIPFEVWALLALVLIALGGSTLVAAYTRQLTPLVPGLIMWMAFVYCRLCHIGLRTPSETSAAASAAL